MVIITRDSVVITFSSGVFVCLFISVCHDICPDDLTKKNWCLTSYVSHTKDVCNDVTRPKSRPNLQSTIKRSFLSYSLEIYISLAIAR